MRKNPQAGLSTAATVIIILVVLLAAGIAYYYAKPRANNNYSTRPQATTNNNTTPANPINTSNPTNSGNTITGKTIALALNPQNNSGESGTAKIFDQDGKATVEITLTGQPQEVAQPAHIHVQSCANLGAVKYPLANVVNGKSETKLNITTDELLGQLPLAINVHKSAQEAGIYVACGDITNGAPASSGTSSGTSNNTATTPATPPAKQTPKSVSFTVTGNDSTGSPTTITINKGDAVQITFQVQANGTYHGGLDFRSPVVSTGPISPGGSKTVTFTATNSFVFTPYWPSTNIQKPYTISVIVN